MSAKLLLRIAALLMLIHVLGHSVGMATWRKADDPVRMEVVRQMNEHSFPFMGAVRSMANYYDAFGYAATLAMLLMVAVL